MNPRIKVGEAIGEALLEHGLIERKKLKEKVVETLEICGLASYHYDRFPHEFSGGQRQRIGIARALILNPDFIVADEPVSALDVSIQAQIINLLSDLQKERQLTYLFISHDLSVVEHLCDRIGVMYLGSMAEMADKKALFSNPLHPYTKALLSAIPIPDPTLKRERIVLQGDIPSPANPPRDANSIRAARWRPIFAKRKSRRSARPNRATSWHAILLDPLNLSSLSFQEEIR
ncbi:Oligopeptide transport ATP-binding protein OppF [Paenibacillus sp. P1XP2]|nr:Oligopeptide transport ATP-binding protein OppF [Paenibacillus sp. P1XP2]